MSLLFHSRAIARSVLGELSPAQDERLRAHLRGCAACRGRYDALAGASRAVNADADASRERARLLAALDRGVGVPASPRRARAWLGAGLVLAPAAAVLLWLARPTPVPDEGVTLRGAAEATSVEAPAAVVLYASRRTGPATRGPLRLVGELPGSGEARISQYDYLQLGVRGLRNPAHARVALVDAAGVLEHLVVDTVLAPQQGRATVALGASVDVLRALAPGRMRLVAVFSDSTIDDAAMRDAAARLQSVRVERGAAQTGVVAGWLVVEK